MKYIKLILLAIAFIGCGGGSGSDSNPSQENSSYPLHKNISTTVFWIGEDASNANNQIANYASTWDSLWMLHYGGIDTPNERNNYLPKGFIPKENPFYVALPYSDFDENGKKKQDILSYIPWATKNDLDSNESICKNRWVKITKGDKTVYAQWEDAGPFGEDDKEYVFANAAPKNSINNQAGLDVSPAVRDYLSLDDIDTTSWQFVDEEDVPDGPWKNTLTTRNIDWVDWYKPNKNVTWQWQLQGELNTSYNVELFDIDLFDTDAKTIKILQQNGKKVICYFSAGSYENWREDASNFPDEALGNDLDDWEGEKWLDIRNQEVRNIILSRLDLAKEKGCDGVEPDNVNGYQNDTGFTLTANDQLDYNKFLSLQARERGLAIALKNDIDQIEELEAFFDFALNEQCNEYDECNKYLPFINHKKAVLNAEYAQKYVDNTDGARDKLCQKSNELHLRTLVLPLKLDDSFRYSCNN